MDVLTVPDLGSFAASWDDLSGRGRYACPGLRSYWLEAWDVPGATYVLVTDGGQLIGGVALASGRHSGLPRLRPGTAGLSVYFDLVVAPGRRPDVVAGVRSWLASRRVCIVHGGSVLKSAAMLEALPGWWALDALGQTHSTPLAATLDDFLDTRPSKFRNEVKRTIRRLDESGVVYRELDKADVAHGVSELHRLQSVRFDDERLVSRDYAHLTRALEAGTERGEARVCGLWDGDRAVVMATNFELDGVVHGVEFARDPDPRWSNAGTVYLARTVESACVRGLKVFDFGPGDAAYKVKWTTESADLYAWRSATPASLSRVISGATDRIVRARRGFAERRSSSTVEP